MKIGFHKYHGTGNDFIVIDNRFLNWSAGQEQVSFLCNRHFGIGADGLMLLYEKGGFDFSMTYFNADGNESTMCGNGGRCLLAFASSLGLFDQTARFFAIDGAHAGKVIRKEGLVTYVTVQMKDVVVDEPSGDHFFIDTGSPHYIVFASDIDHLDVVREARKIRYDTCFAEEGTNVDYVEVMDDHLYVRSYERGVEDETLSCGTGVTASALATAMRFSQNQGFYTIRTRGGKLKVSFKQHRNVFSDIWLEGPAEFVFQGEIEV
jgi:diaminopimelate epimerase